MMGIIKKNLFSENTNQLNMFPDYSKRVVQSFNVNYIAPCDGWLLINYSHYQNGSGQNPDVTINGVSVNSHPYENFSNRYTIDETLMFPVKAFSSYKVKVPFIRTGDHVWFIPLDLGVQVPTTSDIYFPNTLIQQWNNYRSNGSIVYSDANSVVVKSYVDETGNVVESGCTAMAQSLTGTIHMTYVKYEDGSIKAKFTTDYSVTPWNTGQTGGVAGEDHFWFIVYIPLSNIKGIILNNTNKPVTVSFEKNDTSSSGFNGSQGQMVVNNVLCVRMCNSYRVPSPGGTSPYVWVYRYSVNVTGYWQ